MGEEFAASTPFPFFCDFGPDLARAVKAGREREFAAFAAFAAGAERLPDATDPMTFVASKLRWDELEQAPHRDWLAFYRELIALRHAEIVPLLPHMHRGGYFRVHRPHALVVAWPLVDGRALQAAINAGPSAASIPRPNGRVIRATGTAAGPDTLAPWSARWTLQTP
jgi:maltooligosyltrehalose trehalohydrolase